MLARITRNPAFRRRDFRLLAADAALNGAGYGGEQVVLSLLVFRVAESSAWVGIAFALYFGPMLVLGTGFGAAADRFERRRLLRGVELAAAGLLALFALGLAHDLAALATVLGFAIVAGSVRAAYQPVRTSYVFDLVGAEHVVGGLGLVNLAMRAGQLAGALAAGTVAERVAPAAAYALLAIAHLGAFALVARLRSAGVTAERDPAPMLENVRALLAELGRNRTLLTLVLVTAAVEILGFSFVTVLPELATQRFGAGGEVLGAMHAARALGGLAAGLALAAFGIARPGRLYLAVIAAFGVVTVTLALAPVFPVAALALAGIAAAAVASDVLTQSMMQLCVPNRLRGRAMGAWVLAIGAAPLGHVEIGVLAAGLGVGVALAVNGAGLVVVAGLAALAAPRLRR